MKGSFTLILILAASCLYAQHYRCIQPDSTGWYTNGSHYLRAMRIDSVRSVGGTEASYPFKTPRGNRNIMTWPNYMDTTGGSWLGSKIIVWPDGNTGFVNAASDTIFIRSGAGLGDSWTFYDDTSAVHYKATVTALDWQQLWPGTFDSVKEVGLQMMNGSVNLASYKNTYRLLLSKSHGLVQAFDFWNFPYRYYDPASPSNYLDYFLSLNVPTDTAKAFFRKIRFLNLTYRQSYDMQPGDVFQYNTDYNFGDGILQQYRTDSVISRTETPAGISIQIKRTVASVERIPATALTKVVVDVSNASTGTTQPDSAIFPFTRLPEEWHATQLFYYGPLPSSLHSPACEQQIAIRDAPSFIHPDGRLDFGENCGYSVFCYRTGRGLESYGQCVDATWGGYGADLIYCKTGGVPCGQKNTLSLPARPKGEPVISAYPNPASGLLQLRCGTPSVSVHSEIADLSGRVLRRMDWQQSASVDISSLAAGLYLLRSSAAGVSAAELIRVE